MTIYYLSSVDGSDASDGLSWDNAFATFKYAVETASAAASGPHLLYVDSAHSESLSADTTITAAGDLRVLCVNRASGNALTTGAVVGAQATSYSISLAGAYNIYIRGITFRINGTGIKSITLLSSGDGASGYFEECRFDLLSTANNARIYIGQNTVNGYIDLNSCTFKFGSVNQRIEHRTNTVYTNCTVDSAGSVPYLLQQLGHGDIVATGCDFSHVTSVLVLNNTTASTNVFFSNCKFGSGVTIKEAASTVLNKGNVSVWAFNCDAGDNHYALYHGDAFGETTVSTSIYANDGAAYDGTNKCSWKIVTTANCRYYMPYTSPWMDVYHSGTSEISPYLECLRSGSTTKYQDDEVWSEFSYQGTSGSTKATIVSDRMTPLGTAADQTASSLDASGWTGEDATNNAFMKLAPGSAITPAEIGHIRARVVVGEPSITVYVDPKIRGLS